MTRIDQIISDALAGSPETHVAILAREVVRLREAPAVVAPELTDDDLNRYSMDCDERDALEFGYKLAASRFESAGRTVIPPLTDDEIEERYRSLTNGTDELEREWCYKDCRWAYSLAVYRARVAVAGSMLGTGMVAVDAARLAALEAENVRLKIAHLRRMAERADCLRSGWTKMAGFAWASRRAAALDRFRSACLAKIAELKELQCSTKF